MIDLYAHLLFLMLAGHALCDVPLQPAWVSEAKRHPEAIQQVQALLIHGLIHGGAVTLVTGEWMFGAFETIAHMTIDNLKARGRINHLTDQALHLACKVVWAGLTVWML